jgi:RNA polymerase sigma-70 factor (ECF subfamily)
MSLAEASDESLVEEYHRAPASARARIANELFSRHYERVGRWCFRITGDREAAADLAQEVFLKAHRGLDAFKGTARITTWLYTIARNEGLNRLQRAAPEFQDEDALQLVVDTTEGADETVERQSRAKLVRQLLASTLDDTEQTVFTLHYGDEMTLDAITRLLGLDNASGAKAYIVSARRKLARATERIRRRGDSW